MLHSDPTDPSDLASSPQEMLMELKGMDVGFLSSISKLITSCRYWPQLVAWEPKPDTV